MIRKTDKSKNIKYIFVKSLLSKRKHSILFCRNLFTTIEIMKNMEEDLGHL